MMACKSEVILAKLFVTARGGQRQQLIFTNRRIIVLNVIAKFRNSIWQMRGNLDKIPVAGFIMVKLLDIFAGALDRLFKRSRRIAEQLSTVVNEDILSLEKHPKRIAKRIMATSIPYAKIVQPSLGVTIRRRWFAFNLTKIRGLTVRFLPVGRLRSTASRLYDTADYLLPNQLTVDKFVPVLRALKPHLPSAEIYLTETKSAVSVFWPASIGIGTNRWSVRGANAVTIMLTVITLLFLFFTLFIAGSETEVLWGFLWALLSCIGAIDSLAARRFSEAMLIAFLTILLLVGLMVKVIK